MNCEKHVKQTDVVYQSTNFWQTEDHKPYYFYYIHKPYTHVYGHTNTVKYTFYALHMVKHDVDWMLGHADRNL